MTCARLPNMHFSTRPEWMADGFAQARAWCSGQPAIAPYSDAVWPWLIGLLHHDSLADFAAYRAQGCALAARHQADRLCPKMLAISVASGVIALARESAPLSGLHPTLRRGDIGIHTDNRFTRGFLPVRAERLAPAAQALFGLRQAGLHTVHSAARIAGYLILLTLHPYRDGNGRTARLLFAADTWAAGASPLDLLGLIWLHEQRNARFHLAAKCARAGDFNMLFALHAEGSAQACNVLAEPLRDLDAALRWNDVAAAAAAAQAIHATASLHVCQA
ncbi:MAG TPA: Fic family protein [Stenotrophomonas sp.]|nr:Fic family protein [Stenotrophomonas sp.]